jgi:hypothetical protein
LELLFIDGAALPHRLSKQRMADGLFTDCITALTPTVCKLMGVPPPQTATCSSLDGISGAADRVFGGQSAEKCLIFCPDAIGAHLWSRPELDFGNILKTAPMRLELRSVIPPKTPVCFASMFTGAPPEIHGIRRYERPVLSCDTLFDAVLRAKRRVAIVAVRNSSIDLIFRGRALDYFSEAYDSEVLDRALQLVRATDHDLIIAYQQEYDDTLHRTTPLSDECLRAAQNHLDAFDRLAETVRESWRPFRRALIFAPDHGAHLDPATGRGDHGENSPEDMHLFHCYGLQAPDAQL